MPNDNNKPKKVLEALEAIKKARNNSAGAVTEIPRKAKSRPKIKNPGKKPLPLRILKGLLKGVLIAHAAFILLIVFFSALFVFINPPYTSLMLYRQIKNGYKIEPVKYIPLKDIGKSVARMAVNVEDNTYYQHIGIEWAAIERAYKINQKAGKFKIGGSTITQQLARSLFLFPDKWIVRKYLEGIAAIIMNFILGKERVLELYLNYIEWGKGIFGIGAAAEYHYGAPLSDLSMDQKMALLTILPNPIVYNPNNLWKYPDLVDRYELISHPYGTNNTMDVFRPVSNENGMTNIIETRNVFDEHEEDMADPEGIKTPASSGNVDSESSETIDNTPSNHGGTIPNSVPSHNINATNLPVPVTSSMPTNELNSLTESQTNP